MQPYYPQQGPLYPPEQEAEIYEEADYEYEEINDRSNGARLQTVLAFLAGGCLVFICMSVCGLLTAGLWVVDPFSDTTEAAEGSDIGLSFDDPAFPDEPVTNEQQVKLTILDVNRNAALETIPPTEGREIIIVTIELVNLGDEEVDFNERDFMLLNSFEEAYEATVGAITIRDGSLGRGSLPPNEGLEGRLVFEVISGELDLRLLWEPPGRDVTRRYIYLE
jgi:hypothetical protein